MDKLKDYTPFATFLLFAIGTIKMILFGEHYHLAVSNYVSFSNILLYTLNTLRGLLWFAIPVMIFIIFKNVLSPLIKYKWYFFAFSFIGLCITIIAFAVGYRIKDIDFDLHLRLKWILLSGIFFAGVILKKISDWKIKQFVIINDFEIVKISLLICFLFGYMKVEFRYEINEISRQKSQSYAKISFKKDQQIDSIITDSSKYLIHNTAEFLFLYNEKDSSITSIPIANVLFFSTHIIDSTRLKSSRIP